MKRIELPWNAGAGLSVLAIGALLCVAGPSVVRAADDPDKDKDVIRVDQGKDLDDQGDDDLMDFESIGGDLFVDSGGPHIMMLRSGDGDGEGDGAAEHLLAAADKLDLTDAQKTKLREIRRKVPATIMPKRQAVIEAQMDLHDLLEAKDANAAELRKVHDRVLETRKQLDSARFDLRMQAREVLTPEQRAKMHDVRSVIRERIRDGKGPQIHMRRFGHGGSDGGAFMYKF